MQKLSETVYASLFWLISGLLVWLAIVPAALICLPVMLVKALGQVIFKMSRANLVEVEKRSQTNPENKAAAFESLLTSSLLTILIEVPALLAAVISLQPTRLIKKDLNLSSSLPPRSCSKVKVRERH